MQKELTDKWLVGFAFRTSDPLSEKKSCGVYSFPVALPAHSEPRPLIQFRNHFSQTVGPLGRVINQSQGLYLNTGQHKHRINAHRHYALSGIRTHDPSFRGSEDGSCLRPRGYCDRLCGALWSKTIRRGRNARALHSVPARNSYRLYWIRHFLISLTYSRRI
jgi:hypothetical protein